MSVCVCVCALARSRVKSHKIGFLDLVREFKINFK